MRVAALYDVHGIAHALEAVLAELEREPVDAVVFGGDVFCGPLPRDTYELVRAVEGAHFVRGNCERDPEPWLVEQLGGSAVEWARSWPATLMLEGVLYCHATPQSDETILTEASTPERFEKALAGIDARLLVAGHTHIQFRRDRFVNAGSIGMPYEGDVAAFWAIVGDEVEFRRTAFDVERAIADLEASSWPSGRREFVQENLRSALSRAAAIEWLESRVRDAVSVS
jgi:predicted phosphodiesterase